MKLRLLVPLVFCVTVPLAAQSTATSVYAESFRQGATRVMEQTFEAKLTPQNSVYRERIKDLQGADRYTFSIVPQGPEGDTKITSWQVKLADLHHPIYDNVLLTSQMPSDDVKNALWRLEPGNFARVPVGAKRIIKVDSFYVVLQVKAYHFTPPDSPYLDSMTLAVEFRNADPRNPDGSGK
ncbi:MAG TPA: hypothetical protein VNX26_04680 [Candidatus Acidoferrum sp.]|jgi:hypothetical protein|nr:hypothetical protein [Candidatus Acidoferrum sp.]